MRNRTEDHAVRLRHALHHGVRERGAPFGKGLEADVLQFEVEAQSDFGIGGLQNLQGRGSDFRSDPVTRQHEKLQRHVFPHLLRRDQRTHEIVRRHCAGAAKTTIRMESSRPILVFFSSKIPNTGGIGILQAEKTKIAW
ncbi:hypothetical protein NGR_c25930 [Sinorhizobium fredii NGR234]|uniref:Uncharacterized protein n=1 Tax=Sinorhizobium fredii (strain NBRC 101917 / NGR234) TaxID=394 RepID=C3MH64_SINFN|nr:hypothetical protein NGR_c25930 [Sinorhizobium fredii NGR234]